MLRPQTATSERVLKDNVEFGFEKESERAGKGFEFNRDL
jgi:hypothetical protein